MTKSIHVIFVIFILFIGCDKNKFSPDGNHYSYKILATKKIIKITIINVINDLETITANFEYNVNGYINRIVFNRPGNLSYYDSLVYNQDNLLISFNIPIPPPKYNPPVIQRESYLYVYDNYGYLTESKRQSPAIHNFSITPLTTFEYASNKRIICRYASKNPGYQVLDYLNGNLVKETIYEYPNSPSTDTEIVDASRYTYDNNPNVLGALQLFHYGHRGELDLEELNYYRGAPRSKNNIQKIEFFDTDINTWVTAFEYEYTYDEDGYPISCLVKHFTNHTYTYHFEY